MNITKHPLFEEAIASFLRIEKMREEGHQQGSPPQKELEVEELYFNKLFAKCIELMKSE